MVSNVSPKAYGNQHRGHRLRNQKGNKIMSTTGLNRFTDPFTPAISNFCSSLNPLHYLLLLMVTHFFWYAQTNIPASTTKTSIITLQHGGTGDSREMICHGPTLLHHPTWPSTTVAGLPWAALTIFPLHDFALYAQQKKKTKRFCSICDLSVSGGNISSTKGWESCDGIRTRHHIQLSGVRHGCVLRDKRGPLDWWDTKVNNKLIF